MSELFDQITRVHAAEPAGEKVWDGAQVPPSYDAITPAWMTSVLCRDTPGAEVVGVRLDERDDGTSNRRRIFIDYNAAGQNSGLPASVFCKAAETLQNRLSMAASGISRLEPDFYSYARPRLDMEAPVAYYSRFDPDRHTYLVMLRDLGGEVEFADDRTVVDRGRAETMIEALASLHARFYESPELGTASLPFPTWHDYWPAMMKLCPDFGKYCDIAFGDSEQLMEPRLFRRRAEIWPLTTRSVERHRELPHTLQHGDVHLKNWYVTRDNVMGLGDWQAVTVAHWSRDFIYALLTALTIEDRRRWEKDLLRLYLDLMRERGAPRIDADEAWLNCRQQMMTVLAFWTITLRPAPGMPDMQPERTAIEFLKRIYAAMDDHDALDSFRD